MLTGRYCYVNDSMRSLMNSSAEFGTTGNRHEGQGLQIRVSLVGRNE